MGGDYSIEFHEHLLVCSIISNMSSREHYRLICINVVVPQETTYPGLELTLKSLTFIALKISGKCDLKPSFHRPEDFGACDLKPKTIPKPNMASGFLIHFLDYSHRN